MLSHQKENKEAQQNSEIRQLVLHNDDFNTFDYVIDALQKVCGHNKLQAEQCAIITHAKGACDIKHGNIPDLEKMYSILSTKELTVTIE